ncbi:PREDICTED: zinc finger CCCH domain-containing protein 2-like [Ipomoea nil]|uniref:zinc finger CCCH domain-containing protein 2-like n=1 Tax=Ipomoea nil TaxID=35883 RepID=UPI000901EF6E|nr:PREDICTED: zinc finger CCCH domain-containing protein 2-like [Ipomoea nil]
MTSVCEFQNISYPFYLKKAMAELDVSPRKILSRRGAAEADGFLDSPTKIEGGVFQKFLPYNDVEDEDEDGDRYSADHFRMYEFKVRRCTRSRSHDWTDCPFAHPGEKARRRDPRKFHYSGTVCSEFRKGKCGRGDNCEFAHGVFESWLHPARYRTEACKDGKNCKRKVCFFAHSSRQLRILPVNRYSTGSLSPVHDPAEKNLRKNLCCHSPTSTLMGISHSSPPLSPAKTPFCGYGMTAAKLIEMMSYKEALTQLVNSLEQVNLNPLSPATTTINRMTRPFSGNDPIQFSLPNSPSTPGRHSSGSEFLTPQRNTAFSDNGGLTGIDLDWVNDLLT